MKQTTVGVLIILVLAAAAAWFLNARQPVTGHPSTLETPPAMAVEQPEPVVEYPVEDILPEAVEEPVEIEPEPPEPLPELSASDRVISEVAAGLLGADVVAGWMLGASSVAIAGLLCSALMSRQGALVKGLSG